MNIEELMQKAVDINASDIHLKTGNPPVLRLNGALQREEGPALTSEHIMEYLGQLASDDEISKFQKMKELDISYMMSNGVARFRVNICVDDGDPRIVLRAIPMQIKTIDELELPPVMKKIPLVANGLVLVTGVTGSGKSTSLAAMINVVNEQRPVHVLTIEDPLEFVHQDKTAIITQREVGQDTHSFANALRGALRQDPDVILIGEMRDAETVKTALASAETGHLVFSTLHTVDAVETLNRILDFFEPHQQPQIRKQLASVLRAVISQRLVPTADGASRVCAAEILIGTRAVRDFIEQAKGFKDIVRLIEEGHDRWGMQSFDQHLFKLFKAGKISQETAIENATSGNDMRLRLQGMTGSGIRG